MSEHKLSFRPAHFLSAFGWCLVVAGEVKAVRVRGAVRGRVQQHTGTSAVYNTYLYYILY